GEVAGDDIERLLIGTENDGVRPVLAVAFDLAKELYLFKLVVAVGVAEAIKTAGVSAAAVHDDIKRVADVKQTLRFPDRCSNRLNDRRFASFHGDAIKRAVLIGND